MNPHERHEPKESRTAAERRESARRAVASEDDREQSEPFEYPYDERRAGVRARRQVSREEADADMTPGVPGGQGTTGGGQPGGTGVGVPPGGRMDPEEFSDTVGWAEPTEEGNRRRDAADGAADDAADEGDGRR